MIFINKPVPLMAVFVLQGHIINNTSILDRLMV